MMSLEVGPFCLFLVNLSSFFSVETQKLQIGHFVLIELIWEAITIVIRASLKVEIYTCSIKLVCVVNGHCGHTFYK